MTKMDREVTGIFVDCLQELYRRAGVKRPYPTFDPQKEAQRLAEALAAKASFPLEVTLPEVINSGANIHRVPARQWSRWTFQARWMFNNVMNRMADQALVKHPDYEDAPGDYWDTVRWNAAWIAADLTNEYTRCK